MIKLFCFPNVGRETGSTHVFLQVSRGLGGFRELRETCRSNFHPSWYLYMSMVTSCDENKSCLFSNRVRYIGPSKEINKAIRGCCQICSNNVFLNVLLRLKDLALFDLKDGFCTTFYIFMSPKYLDSKI